MGRSAPHVGPQHNQAKSALRGACFVGSRPNLHGTKSARGARHGTQARRSQTFEDRVANLPQHWCGRASADGVRRRASRVGPKHNHAKSALRGACSAGGRPIIHGAKSARAARHGIRTRRSQTLKKRVANMSWCWCGQASADGVRRSAPRVGPQHNHAKSALRGACSVGGRPIFHRA